MKKANIGRIVGQLMVVAAVWIGASTSANAAMIQYTGGSLGNTSTDVQTAGVVGTSYGATGSGQGNWTYKSSVAQAVLNLAFGGNGTYLGESTYANNVYDYSGTVDVDGATLSGGAANTAIPAGWDFVIAKYDGQNAGYVVFYLGGASVAIPQYPANYWTDNPNQWGISGWTAFNVIPTPTPVPEPTTMIAGGLLLLPFAVSTLRMMRRKRTA